MVTPFKDINVSVKHSKDMHKALKREGKSTEVVLYDEVAHRIWRENYRIDMLDKTAAFIARHMGVSHQ